MVVALHFKTYTFMYNVLITMMLNKQLHLRRTQIAAIELLLLLIKNS